MPGATSTWLPFWEAATFPYLSNAPGYTVLVCSLDVVKGERVSDVGERGR